MTSAFVNDTILEDLYYEVLGSVQARWMSVTMLLCFMGASMGWSISWQLFVDTALLAYLSGATAQQVHDQLKGEEFSQAGTIFQAVSSAGVAAEKINSEAFARCSSEAIVSCCIITEALTLLS